ncbi:metallophosphoesterase family protein [Labilibaculum euxinus]|uniref:Metallophosphoesterase n=1 Tax=Labilibaculum euxinus TaxID=2686357 RepID=A0A7M4D293_9BACT|nr:metallophosphoesterase [Labilibaculum euxinus]MUP36772.1 metallophosphoesterase [Labilibaculum euxinus]MVB05977.1 metallophosphoesterase [Labilibaculum euxinus]
MTKILQCLLLAILLIGSNACEEKLQTNESIQIAFMADVHLNDIYGEFQDCDYKGVVNPANGKFVIARTMEAQLNSTRIFNENYFAFLAALDDVVKRNIKFVVLPGDFSDDGQPFNVRGLKKILDSYSDKYGIKFIATTGNHDPVRPFAMDAGKKDFLGAGGKPQVIMSADSLYVPLSAEENPVVVTKDICRMGYEEVITTLGDFGFFPKKEDLYWETPFTSYTYNDYAFDKAFDQSSLNNRNYSIPPFNASIPDVSYLVEPVRGVWFLAIDANVYVPNNNAETDSLNADNYEGASAGYSNVLTHKKHLIKWVKKVSSEADRLGKTLIVFSHYPMIDFNDDASPHIKNLMGEGKMQLHRVPDEDVARTFAEAGIKLHFGGHMHINDTGIRKYENGTGLVNVQIPSLAAYIPAYKILTVKNKNLMEVETVVIDSVPRFKELFPIYEQEYSYLKKSGTKDIWNKDILSATTYHEFTNWHLKELVRLRFLKKDWPAEFRDFLLNATGKELLNYTNSTAVDSSLFENWTGFGMIFDFYRLRSADKLAIKDIGLDRIKQYQIIIESLLQNQKDSNSLTNKVQNDFYEFAEIFHHFLNGAPADHFQIDLKNAELVDLVE